MEELLSPREFIKRFHLPQLVRISSTSPLVNSDQDQHVSAAARDDNAKYAPRGGQQAPPRRPEQRDLDWTYSSGGGGESGSKSLHFADSTRRPQPDTGAQGPVSLNGFGAGGPAARLLPRVKLSREPRPLNDQTFLRPTTASRCDKTNSTTPTNQSAKSDKLAVKSPKNNIKLMPPSKRPTLSKLELEQPFLVYKAHRKLEICAYAADSNNQLHDKSGDPIYFSHNYQGWFSIRPTTTSSRYDKTRRTAGDIRRKQHEVAEEPEHHLETLDQVCQAGGQVFLTRDELIGYQLPSKLSNLTKLKNDQLLAVPLAINLNPNTGRQGDKKSEATKKASHQKKGSPGGSSSSTINDLSRCVIGAGRVLRICGIYEDVLPIIEGASKQQQHIQSLAGMNGGPQHRDLNGSKISHQHLGHAWGQPATSNANHTSHYYGQMLPGQYSSQASQLMQQALSPPIASQVNYQQQQQQQVVYGFAGVGDSAVARRDQRLMRQQLQQQQQHYGPGDPQIVAPPIDLIYQNNNQQQQRQKLTAAAFGAQPAVASIPRQAGKRYARCVILSDESVDQLTGCTTPGGASGAVHKNSKCDSGGGSKTDLATPPPETEIEVLIPLNLLGRFYLCATGQTIANELHCHDCSLAAHRSSPYLIFRLSQIVYLINVNKRLSQVAAADSSGSTQQQQQQQARLRHSQWHPFSSTFTLPLQVRLVMGPRPASFSPAMFGLSSTMESYFASEHNVGGHALACKFNRTSRSPSADTPVAPSSSQRTTSITKQQANKDLELATPTSSNSSPVCACPQELKAAAGLCWFSGSLRLDSMAKRDVLLACTIKQSPLRHSDLIGLQLKASGGCGGGESTSGQQHKSSLKSGKATRSGVTLGRVAATKSSTRLDELLEMTTAAEQLGFATDFAVAPPTAQPAAAKSSMSRLRACRSLISLNGRRQKKKRPDIPSSMLSETVRQLAGSTRDGATGSGGDFIDKMGAQLVLQGDMSTSSPAESEPIILIELDCNADEELDGGSGGGESANNLWISRTFVERSLPASSIPDLVVNRMNYCQANSHLWERQLKLSQASLSRDFDSCKRQLASLMARQGPGDDRDDLGRQQVGPASSMLFVQDNQQYQRTRDDEPDFGGPSQQDLNQTGGNLTASSRSSSGVSSSGEHHRARFMLTGQSNGNLARKSSRAADQKHPTGSSSTSSSLSNLGGACSTSSPGSSSASNQDGNSKDHHQVKAVRTKSSRLLRLVQKILPTSSTQSNGRSESVVANCHSQMAPRSADTRPQQPRRSQQHSTSSGCDVSSSSSTTLSSGGGGGRGGGQRRDKAASKQQQQLKLMEELNGRFRSKLSLMTAGQVVGSSSLVDSTAAAAATSVKPTGRNPSGKSKSQQRLAPDETLMNAQKVHKRLLLTGSMRHLPSELLNRMMEDNEQDDDDDERPFDSKSCTQERDHGEDDDSSHLYESLERLNSADCLQSEGAGDSSRLQVHEQLQASHSSRLMMKIQLIKQQQQRRRQQQQRRASQAYESLALCPERPAATCESEPALAARSRPGLGGGGGKRQDVAAEEADEWWRRPGEGASSEDEAAARATSGGASGNARRPLVAPNWRQRLVASVGGGGGQQRKPTGGKQQRESRLCHSMELFGNGGGGEQLDGDPARQQRQQLSSSSDAESCAAGEELDMEPVSIEACEQHAGQLSASDDDEQRPGCRSPTRRQASDRECNRNRADNDSPSSSFASSSSPSSGSSCSLTALTGQQQRRPRHGHLIGTPPTAARDHQATCDGDIYVNLIPQATAAAANSSSWSSIDELRAQATDAARQAPGAAGEQRLEMSPRNLRLVGRMERKLAKLRGRKELPARQASPAMQSGEPAGELRSLGWEPADELRLLLASGRDSQSMICINGESPAQATQGGGGGQYSASSSLSRTSSSSSASSLFLTAKGGGGDDQTTDTVRESKAKSTTARPVVAYGNGGCQRGRDAEAAPHKHSGPRSIVTLDRPTVAAPAADVKLDPNDDDDNERETNWTNLS